jgi:hypothetical protein
VELAKVELHLLTPDKLVDIDAVERHYQRQTIRLRHIEDVIDGDHRSGAGHVLRHDLRLPRNIFGHVSGEEARPSGLKSARRRANHDPNCLSPVESVTLRSDFR